MFYRRLKGRDHQVRGSKITTRSEHRFTAERCQRIHRAVAQVDLSVELSATAHAFPKRPNAAIAALVCLYQTIETLRRFRAYASSQANTSFKQRN